MAENPYDGKVFEITTPDETNRAAGYLGLEDGSIAPACIRGAIHGSRYALDPKKTGNSDDYIEGPWVGPEIDEFIAKRGGVVGSGNDVAPWPGWTLEQYVVGLSEAVKGGPNAGPDRGAEYRQEGDQIVPVNQPAETPVPEAFNPAAPAPVAPEIVAQHESLIQRLRDLTAEVEAFLKTHLHL